MNQESSISTDQSATVQLDSADQNCEENSAKTLTTKEAARRAILLPRQFRELMKKRGVQAIRHNTWDKTACAEQSEHSLNPA